MRWMLAVSIAIAGVLAPTVATATHSCDSNPDCNAGRGSLAGYTCVRSEVNTMANEGNGRICTESVDGGTWYVYLRALVNRDWVVLCNDGEVVLSIPQPTHPSVCEVVSH